MALRRRPRTWRFEALLQWQDPELVRYLIAGEIHSDPDLAALLQSIRGV